MTELLRSVMTSYVMYFNKKYQRVGPLFQTPFRASLIDKDAYLHHISRYIHLNPGKGWKDYEYSSIGYYRNIKIANWININSILELYDDKDEYIEFVGDYLANKQLLDELKWELANDLDN